MEWYYASQGQQKGPVSKERLIELHEAGEILLSDLVWNNSMADWAPLGTLPELAGDVALPPPPPESTPGASSAGNVAGAGSAATLTRPSVDLSQRPTTYLWQSIACMLCCCLPLGIPALIFACKVDPAFQLGDLAAAEEASRKARLFCILAFVLGFVVQGIYLALVFVGGFAGALE